MLCSRVQSCGRCLGRPKPGTNHSTKLVLWLVGLVPLTLLMVTVSGNPNPTNPTYPTNRTNPTNPTTKYRCE